MPPLVSRPQREWCRFIECRLVDFRQLLRRIVRSLQEKRCGVRFGGRNLTGAVRYCGYLSYVLNTPPTSRVQHPKPIDRKQTTPTTTHEPNNTRTTSECRFVKCFAIGLQKWNCQQHSKKRQYVASGEVAIGLQMLPMRWQEETTPSIRQHDALAIVND